MRVARPPKCVSDLLVGLPLEALLALKLELGQLIEQVHQLYIRKICYRNGFFGLLRLLYRPLHSWRFLFHLRED